MCFRVKTKEGRVNDALTKVVIDEIKNIDEGFISPGFFKGYHLIRIVIGNYHSDIKTITQFYHKIKEIAIKQRETWGQ